MSSPTYENLVSIIANVIIGLSHDDSVGDGVARYQHFCENNLNAPCDILQRLGVMVETPGGMGHSFRPSWVAGDDVTICRHSGEPAIEDLYIAIKFYADWFPKHVTRTSINPNRLRPPRPFFTGTYSTPERKAFFEWAMECVINELVKVRAGRWSNKDKFVLNESFYGHKGLEDYWRRRSEMVQKFGGDECSIYPPNKKDCKG